MADRNALPTSDKGRLDTQRAWIRRNALKLTNPTVDVSAMTAAWDAETPQSAQSQQMTVWAGYMEKCFERKPMMKAYEVAIKPLPESNHDSRGFRQTLTRGTAKGTWSIPGALMAAVLTQSPYDWGNSDKNRDKGLQDIDAWWADEDEETVLAWLDESIRPGLTHRGMAATLMLLREGPSICRLEDLLTRDLEASMRAAVDAALAVTTVGNVSENKLRLHVYQWSFVLEKSASNPLIKYARSSIKEWERILTLDKPVYNLRWDIKTIEKLTDITLRQIRESHTDTQEAFNLARSLVLIKNENIRFSPSNNKNERNKNQVFKGKLFIAMSEKHRANPAIGAWFEQEVFDEQALNNLIQIDSVLGTLARSVQATHALEVALPKSLDGKKARARM